MQAAGRHNDGIACVEFGTTNNIGIPRGHIITSNSRVGADLACMALLLHCAQRLFGGRHELTGIICV